MPHTEFCLQPLLLLFAPLQSDYCATLVFACPLESHRTHENLARPWRLVPRMAALLDGYRLARRAAAAGPRLGFPVSSPVYARRLGLVLALALAPAMNTLNSESG